jgi:hypothetical protein
MGPDHVNNIVDEAIKTAMARRAVSREARTGIS